MANDGKKLPFPYDLVFNEEQMLKRSYFGNNRIMNLTLIYNAVKESYERYKARVIELTGKMEEQ